RHWLRLPPRSRLSTGWPERDRSHSRGGRKTMTDALLELFRHKTWATLRLIEYCQHLADEHLDATIPGTFGTIHETLRHLVGADEGYFSILTRKRLSEPLPDGVIKLDELPAGPVPLDDVAKRLRHLGPRWAALGADAAPPG